MKYLKYAILVGFLSRAFCVGEAGAIFLLINPGAGPAGSGEAQVAKANDAYASYYNPAGLGFLKGSEIVLQHVNWLPNLADDIFYDFLAFRKHVNNIGTFGGHIIYLNLGEQTQTDELGNSKGLFKSYMMAFNGSFGTQISRTKSIGVNFKMFHQKLAESSVVNEDGDPYSTDFAFDIGYLQKLGRNNKHSFGLSIQNIGPPIDFIDSQQADPAPTNMKIGIYTELFNDGVNKLNFLFDANKLLVGTYPAMDWNGDGIISGSDEQPHNDPWYKGIFTAWLDDWYYGGDYDLCEDGCPQQASDFDLSLEIYGSNDRDNRIGGFEEYQMEIIQNDPVYNFFNSTASGHFMFPHSENIETYDDLNLNNVWDSVCYNSDNIYLEGILTSDDCYANNPSNSWSVEEFSDYNNDGIWSSDSDGYCNQEAGETCTNRLLTDINSILTANQIESSYQQYFNQSGFTCGDAMILQTNDNSDENILFWDNDIDDCGTDWTVIDVDNEENYFISEGVFYCDEYHHGDNDGDGYCDNYYLEISDFSHNDQYLIPTFSITDVLNQNLDYLDNHFFQNGNMHDWYEENNKLSDFNGVLQKKEETIYIPNYIGFCGDKFSSYDGLIFNDGYVANDHSNSLCYDQEGDSYYEWTNLGTLTNPIWDEQLNPNFGTLSWIDIPHDGLASHDRYHIDCNDDLSNNFYCNGDWIGITEETYIANTVCDVPGFGYNDPDCPTIPTLLTECPEESGTCNNLLLENDWNSDGIVNEDDITHIESEGYMHINDDINIDLDGDGTTMLDVNLDGSGDYWAWYLDSDNDGNLNAKEAHHDLDIDGSDQHETGGYDFKDSKYGYYNAHGNYEKGSGDDRSFSDELEEVIYNMGFEWEYTESFIVRLGFIYDLEGEIKSPTFGAGLKFDKYGFDFGYTAGDDDDARSQTMFLSISLGL